MAYDYVMKIRIYPNKEQMVFLNGNFGCCRFVYNKMLEERKHIYQLYKNNRKVLRDHKYKTENKDHNMVYDFPVNQKSLLRP